MAELTADLPLVDLEGDSASAELRRGLFETGFLLLRDHAIPRSLLDGVRAVTTGFMDRPEAEKRAQTGPLRGWTGFREESAGKAYGTDGSVATDACQKYSMGPIVPSSAADPDYDLAPEGAAYFAANVFPNDEMRNLWESYYRRMETLCARLIDSVRQALDLPTGIWDAQTSSPVSVLRFLSYPDLEGGVRMGAHYDDTLVTVLHQSVPENGYAALQVKLPGESDWHSVVPSDDVFVVNFGETLTFLSGGRVVATEHRVMAAPPGRGEGSARTSLAHFHLPNWNARLWPASVEGIDGQRTRFHLDALREPDGSVLFYKGHQHLVDSLTGLK